MKPFFLASLTIVALCAPVALPGAVGSTGGVDSWHRRQNFRAGGARGWLGGGAGGARGRPTGARRPSHCQARPSEWRFAEAAPTSCSKTAASSPGVRTTRVSWGMARAAATSHRACCCSKASLTPVNVTDLAGVNCNRGGTETRDRVAQGRRGVGVGQPRGRRNGDEATASRAGGWVLSAARRRRSQWRGLTRGWRRLPPVRTTTWR